MREVLLDTMIGAPERVSSVLEPALESIAEADFPARWGSLLPRLVAQLQASEPARVHAALRAALALAKSFEWRDQERRAPLEDVVAATFEPLARVLDSLDRVPLQHAEAAHMQSLALRVFYSCMQYGLPAAVRSPDAITPWLDLSLRLLLREIDPQLPEHAQKAHWHAKKTALRVWLRLFGRVGNTRCMDPDAGGAAAAAGPGSAEQQRELAWSRFFEQQYAPRLLATTLELLSWPGRGLAVPGKILALCVQFCDDAMRYASTWALLRRDLGTFLERLLFPLLCFGEEDAELWSSDPNEYIHREYDVEEEFFSPRANSVNLLIHLARFRPRRYFERLMQFLHGLLEHERQAPAEQRDPRRKDGALCAVGALNYKLKRSSEYAPHLQALLIAYVYPEFESPHGFLRARACWVLSQFYDAPFADEAAFLAGLERVLRCLQDPELPVRVAAAIATKYLLWRDLGRDAMRPLLPRLLQELLALTRQIDSDDVIECLQHLIERYPEEMLEYAVPLLASICEQLLSRQYDPEDDQAGAATEQCFESLRALLDVLRKRPECVPQVQSHLLAIVRRFLSPDCVDLLQPVLDVLAWITFYAPLPLADDLWTAYPLLLTAATSYAVDYLDDMLAAFDNFVSRGTDAFLARQLVAPTLEIFARLARDAKSPQYETGVACKLVECVLLACHSHRPCPQLDALLPDLLALTLTRYQTASRSSLRVLLVSVLVNVIFYAPAEALAALEARGWTQQALALWLAHAEETDERRVGLPRLHDKKLSLCALTALLAAPPPGPLQSPQALVTLLRTALRLHRAYEEQRRQEAEQAAAEKDSDEDEDENGGGSDDDEMLQDGEGDDEEEDGEDEEVDDEEDVQPEFDDELGMLAMAARMARQQFRADDDFDDGLLQKDEEESSLLDALEPAQLLLQASATLNAARPDLVAQMQPLLDTSELAYLAQLATPQPATA